MKLEALSRVPIRCIDEERSILRRDIHKGYARARCPVFSCNSKNSKIIGLANENIWSEFGEV